MAIVHLIVLKLLKKLLCSGRFDVERNGHGVSEVGIRSLSALCDGSAEIRDTIDASNVPSDGLQML